MALRFLEGFDHYAGGGVSMSTHEVGQRWSEYSAFGGGVGCSGSIVSGRFGNGYQGSASNCEFWFSKTLDDQATWIVGWAFRQAGFSSPSGIFRLLDSGSVVHLSIYPGTDGSLNLYRGDGSTLLDSSAPFVLVASVWYYLEVKATIADAGGVFNLRVNGVEVASYSGDTRNAGVASARTIAFGGDRTQTGTTVIDDIYICDSTGSAPHNDYLGDIRVEALYPNGNGNSSQLDGSDGNTTDNYLLVDDTGGNDGESTYVESGDVGDKDTYAYGNLSAASGTVYGVQPLLKARKTDAGSKSVASVARVSGTEEDSANVSLPQTYTINSDLRTTKPGGGAWSVSDVNGAEFGMKVTA